MRKLVVALSTCVALSFAGCIDRDFDLAQVSGEVTVGGEELVVPLTDVDNIYLGDIIPENETLKKDSEGMYRISFSSFGDDPSKYESISIDGIEIPTITGLSPKLDPVEFNIADMPTSLVLDNIVENFTLDFPTLKDAVEVQRINIEQNLDLNLPSQLSGSGTLSEAWAGMIPQISCKAGDSTTFSASITIMEELEKIDYVEFGNETEPGALFNVELDLAGIAGINGGGSAKVNVTFPEGYYLCDKDGVGLPVHNILSREVAINKGDDKIQLSVYLQKIDYSQHTFAGGKLNIEDTITYSYELNVTACAGTYDLNAKPKFVMSATPVYKDIEVVINHIELPSLTHDIDYRFDNIPENINIKTLSFTDSHISFYVKGIEWIEIRDNISNEVFSPSLEIVLPSCMHFKSSPYVKGNILLAESADLAKGITLDLDYIDFSDPAIVREANAVVLKTLFEAKLHMDNLDGRTILASSLTPPTDPMNIEVGMTGMKFNIDKVTLGDEMIFNFDLNSQLPSLSQEIEIPEMISNIERIVIGKANGNGAPVGIDFALNLPKGKSFPVDELDLKLAINLGKLLKPTQATLDSGIIAVDESGNYILSFNETWAPNKNDLTAHLEFDALQNIPEIKNGKIKLDQIISVDECSVSIKNGADVDVAAIKNTALNIALNIDDIEAREFTGSFDLTVAPEDIAVELGDEISKLGVDINALKLNPVLKLNIKENPTGIPLFADVVLKTYDSEDKLLTEIVAPTITIPGSGAVNIVISTPRNATSYPEATFVAIPGLADLLSKGIPSKIVVSLVAGADKGVHTIDLLCAKQGYLIEYQYEVEVPLEFEGDVDLSYSTTISDLNETFATLGDEVNGLKVGDVGIVAKFGTTIPFDIKLAAKLVNRDGTTENVEAKLVLSNDGKIDGWRESDGENPHLSTLAIDFDLGESHTLTALKNVDGIQLTFTLTDTGTSETTALKAQQYINGSIKLRVRDGLSANVLELLNGNLE